MDNHCQELSFNYQSLESTGNLLQADKRDNILIKKLFAKTASLISQQGYNQLLPDINYIFQHSNQFSNTRQVMIIVLGNE